MNDWRTRLPNDDQNNDDNSISMVNSKQKLNYETLRTYFQPQPPDTPMSNISEVPKIEINHNSHGMPMPLSSGSSHHGHAARSKPQACKVCGKMLSSASSYYVHMKLHSGTKPFQCTVSLFFKCFGNCF